ncbi:Plasmodium exported protein (Pm-fam-a like), unknown function [Plasmodium malariae]|uniref:Fam-l protein n=1 Tax=Plasmodium malariae TaxID=5858 RepID=A0A1A8WNI0_PLAMA|nr:Plasmodium exported protein (Pm-fam-a like), unknown function [Plasmodium malariae]
MKLLFLIKFAVTFNNNLDWSYKLSRKIDKRTYRLLENYKNDKYLSIIGLKEETSYKGQNEKKYICTNEKGNQVKKKQKSRSSLNNGESNKQDMKNKSCIFETKIYSHLEKKVFKELDYVDFIKNNKAISDKLYKKIILKKCGLRISLPLLLFLLLSISLILDLFVGYGPVYVLKVILKSFDEEYYKRIAENFYSAVGPLGDFFRALFTTYKVGDSSRIVKKLNTVNGLFGILIHFLPFIILGVIIISGIIYYHKKVKKYEKIKFRRR